MTRRQAVALLLVVLALSLAGCGDTPVTSTPAATSTPVPVKSPDATTIVQRLKAAGMPVGDVVAWTAETDPNHLLGRPSQYISKATFRDTRIPATADPSVDAGGDVEVFNNESDLKARKDYIEAIVKSTPLVVQYVYGSNVALLRLSKILTPDQAAQYQQALTAAAK